ncbi:MAG TPA: hypothetical protein VGJ05_01790 [Fimbriiglobus sp.]|jgi:hypothetical protein
MVTRILVTGFLSLLAATAAKSQDFTRMDLNAMNNAFNARMNTQIASQTQSIIGRNLNDPRVQAAYRQHLAQGGRYTPQQFAYMYAATAGFTPNGIANFRATEARNRSAELYALNGYRQAQAARGQAQLNYMNGFHHNNNEFGNLLRGNTTYTNPYTGSSYVLPHTLQTGQYYRDSSGNVFQMDARGNYSMLRNGWWYPLNGGR